MTTAATVKEKEMTEERKFMKNFTLYYHVSKSGMNLNDRIEYLSFGDEANKKSSLKHAKKR